MMHYGTSKETCR